MYHLLCIPTEPDFLAVRAGSAMGWNIQVVQPITLKDGKNSIDLLSMTLGLQVLHATLPF